MLARFYIAVEDFEAAIDACNSQLAKCTDIDHRYHHRMHDIGHDIVALADGFITAHIAATMWSVDETKEVASDLPTDEYTFEEFRAYCEDSDDLSQEARDRIERSMQEGQSRLARMQRRSNSRAGERSRIAGRDLKTYYKAYLYFLRAFHDAAAQTMLSMERQPAGDKSSMERLRKAESGPVAKHVAAIPGYDEWFTWMRECRLKVKRGTRSGLCGPQWDVGIAFHTITSDNRQVVDLKDDMKLRLGDLVRAFELSKALVDSICEHAADVE